MRLTGRSTAFSTRHWAAGIVIMCSLGYAGIDGTRAAPTTLLIVRHADRIADQDALSSAGVTRAQELVHVAAKAGVAGIYCSKTVRTRKTAEPLATALGITPVELEPNDIDGLIKHILANHRGKTVLVVGHSNTIPKIIAAAGGPTLSNLPEDDFDNLFVLNVGSDPSSEVRLVNLQYGAASP